MSLVVDQGQWADPSAWIDHLYSGGLRRAGGDMLKSFEPATGDLLARVGTASAEDVSSAAAFAREAQIAWGARPPHERASVLARVIEVIEARRDELIDWTVREGASIVDKGTWEVDTAIDECHQAMSLTRIAAGEVLPALIPGELSLARRVPVGVVGIINPWNGPFFFAMRGSLSALALGNAVLLKPDPNTPVSGAILPAMVYEEAGLPEGLLHALPGGVQTGEAIVGDPNVDMIFFTGSSQAGRAIARTAGLKRTLLELGGKNPFIVLSDADIERAASSGAFSSFHHSGQGCICAGRHVVHESVIEEYTEALTRHLSALKLGNPRDPDVLLGPIINERQAQRVERIVSESVAAGAEVVTGGARDGLFYEATILSGVRPGMSVYHEETFGPVVAIVPFTSDDEAVEIANDTDYGLTAAVHSRSLPRAMAIADRLHVGMCHVNGVTTQNRPFVPFGGVGASGNGTRLGGTATLEQFTQWKWITTNAAAPPTPFDC